MRKRSARLDQQKKPRPILDAAFFLRDRCLVVAPSDCGLRLAATTAQDAEAGNEAADTSERGRFGNGSDFERDRSRIVVERSSSSDPQFDKFTLR